MPLTLDTKAARRLLCGMLLALTAACVVTAVTYTDQFVFQVIGGPDVAQEIARKHGFIYLGEIFKDYYHVRHRKLSKRSVDPSVDHHIALNREPKVKWFAQQTLKRRVKRDFLPDRGIGPPFTLNDPRWPQMWYLNRGQMLDMNVQAAWAKGVTGNGIIVTILDDGLEKDHPDIVRNYDPKASYDVNNHDADPQPRYDIIDSNRHGTRCAGEVAAEANNTICAIGVAYEAGVGGVRMLDGDVTDAVEAQSLSLNPQHIDIYSASWGPDDDGKTVDGPGMLATRAFIEGIEKGRNGLGSIFIWASGNGGREHDNCNCDGYTNAIWTLSISSATENGLVPWYSEACSSSLASTYSSGSSGERQIITTDLHHGCTSSHTGTSASAPLAAGICALALEANKKLTWRDMQHIVVRTARPANLHSRDWKTNGVGRNVSHSFGYGLMDAAAMVDLARKWATVPPQKKCEVKATHSDKLIPAKSHVELRLHVYCQHVRFLEHVQAKITLSSTRRGDIHIYLTSPAGTRSTILAQRPMDSSRSGFQSWPFMTVHNWGESPNGIWKLEVHNEGRFFGRASLKEWSLHFFGTYENPDMPRVKTTTTSTTSTTTTTTTTTSTTTTTTTTTTTPKPRTTSTTVKPRDYPKQTHQYYPLTTAKPQVYPLDQSKPRNGVSGGLLQTNRNVGAQNTVSFINGCQQGMYLYERSCVTKCPTGYFAQRIDSNLQTEIPKCSVCHYSCISCVGPNDYQCTGCYGDASLQNNYCQPKSLLQQIDTFTRYSSAITTVFVVLCVLAAMLLIYILTTRELLCTTCRDKRSPYRGVPTDSEGQKDYPQESSMDEVESKKAVNLRFYEDTDDEI